MNDDYDLNGDNTEDEETIEETETVKETATGSSTSPSFYDSETLSEDFIKEDTVKNVHYNFLIFGNGTVNYKRIRDTENPFIIYYYTLEGILRVLKLEEYRWNMKVKSDLEIKRVINTDIILK